MTEAQADSWGGTRTRIARFWSPSCQVVNPQRIVLSRARSGFRPKREVVLKGTPGALIGGQRTCLPHSDSDNNDSLFIRRLFFPATMPCFVFRRYKVTNFWDHRNVSVMWLFKARRVSAVLRPL